MSLLRFLLIFFFTTPRCSLFLLPDPSLIQSIPTLLTGRVLFTRHENNVSIISLKPVRFIKGKNKGDTMTVRYKGKVRPGDTRIFLVDKDGIIPTPPIAMRLQNLQKITAILKDPCAGVVCPGGEICLVTEGRVPRCSCPEMCPLQESPVCATDGQTYSNECYMRLESCRARKTLSVMYRDSCSSGINPCTELKCTHGSTCHVSKDGKASCQCPPPCEEVMRPVCATDGRTYESSCHLQRIVCLEKLDLGVSYTGACGVDGPCSQKNCGPLAVCRQNGNIAECVCNTCGSEYEPVCGTDGISYGNVCKLRREACLKSKSIDVLYQGLCDGCENKKCDFFSICVSDSSGLASCVCNTNCTASYNEKVCGTDGIAYRNQCELKLTACQNKMNIQIAYKGDCESCAGVVCQYNAKCHGGRCICPTDCSAAPVEQVCGSDLVTYVSQCHLLKRACELNDKALDVLFFGSCERRPHRPLATPLSTSIDKEEVCRDVKCDFDATCEADEEGYPRCVCSFECSKETGREVCGSDLNMYQSSCHMRAEACNTQAEIRARPLELCQGMQVKPCGGDSSLKDPETGEDLDCGNGHNRQDCPTDYYCHQTSSFAKCCKKGKVYARGCEDSWYGCCPDGKTPAQGLENEGCPKNCGCNKIGSYSDWCDDEKSECKCRPGVGGPKCDRCESGYWGLPKISSGHRGCLPCGCSLFGSVREDCEQMTGKCVCKPGVSGDKCDTCRNSKHVLTPAGCTLADTTTPVPTSCSQLICYFGAVCEERDNRATCVCAATCPQDDRDQVVCGSDGQTYGSECQLVLYACKYQIDIAVVSLGPCKDIGYSFITESPSRHWTSYSHIANQLSKSTRHLLQDRYNLPGRHRDAYYVEGLVTSAGHSNAKLGEHCSYSDDCVVPGSLCNNRVCTCEQGLIPTHNKNECIKEEIPSFNGQSWIRLKQMKAYHKFNLEIEFSTYNTDGILFYAQQSVDGMGDFIALSIVNSYVLLSYNLGSGTVRASSTIRVSMGTWHRVKVRRYQRDALLQVDNESPVPVQSHGSLVALDLSQPPYLGYVPTNFSKVFQNIGSEIGLVGCIKTSQFQIEDRIGMDSCENNACKKRPCQNQGTCFPIEDGKAICHCPHNFTGNFCEDTLSPCAHSVCSIGTQCSVLNDGGFDCECNIENCEAGDIISVLFEGTTISFPKLEGISRAFSITIWFKSFASDASLIFNSQSSHMGKGDYLSLIIEKGKPIFSFSLGGNPAIITTNETISIDKWHSLHISRTDKDGTLRLDSGPVYKGQSSGDHYELNLEQPLYIGKPPYMDESPHFSGVIQKLVVNGERIPLSLAKNAIVYDGGPCRSNSCPENLTCLPLLNEFHCLCITPFCFAKRFNDGIYFDGNTAVKYPRKLSRRNESEEYNEYDEVEEIHAEEVEDSDEYSYDYYEEKRRGTRIELWMRTEEMNGPLLVSKSPKTWALMALEGRIVLTAWINEKHFSLTSKVRIDDGKWHHIIASRRRKVLNLQVDSEPAIKMTVGRNSLAGAKRFWFGGCPSLPTGLPEIYYLRFKGCIRGVKVDHLNVDLMSLSNELEYCVDNNVR